MVIGKVWGGDGARLTIKAFTDVQICAVITSVTAGTFVAGPAEILHRGVSRIRNSIDLFPIEPAYIAKPHLVRSRADRGAKRIAQSIGDNTASIRVGMPG